MNIRAEKDALREEYAEKRRSLSVDERAESDALICRALTACASFRFADLILAYAPKTPEIDVFPAIKAAIKDGKRVAFPRCFKGNIIRFFYATPDELEVGAFGIREPKDNAPPCTQFQNAVCLVPGLLFDKDGYRIGYGKGYYDRFLRDFSGATLGIARQDFILPHLPRGRFDKNVQALVCERGVMTLR